ncbi:MAG: hypothetical protein AAGH87_03485 [Pseudomonadota bacterium]
MYSSIARWAGAAAAAALAVAASAAAQVEALEIGTLGDIDPFGRGYLQAGETAMPTNMWAASRTEDLLPLMREVRTRQLTPAERTLLRRVVLSPAARPSGERASEVLGERARILYELGEADAASDLLGRLEENPRGLNAAELSVDLQLALGNEATACRQLVTETREGAYWAKLRAVCAVLQKNVPAAELAVELAETQGVDDDWFFEAVFAASAEDVSDLPAKFDSGLNLALSTALALEPPNTAIAAVRPDLAAAIAGRPTVPLSVRVPAAGVAAESGLLEGRAHRQLYRDLVRAEGFEPQRSIELAVQAFEAPDIENQDRARRLAMALRSSSSNPARFAAAARLFAQDLERIGRNGETARHALVFARAELAGGDVDTAGAWVQVTTLSDAPEPDQFDVAFMRAVLVLAGHGPSLSDHTRIAETLVESAESETQQDSAARLFALWTSRGVAPPPTARALMAAREPETGVRGDEWRMLSIRAAAQAGAAGEVVVSTLGLTLGDPTGLAAPDLLAILDSLSQIGAGDAADLLALEASGYWKMPG